MDNLTAGIWLFLLQEKRARIRLSYPASESLCPPVRGAADFTGIGGSFRVEFVAGLPWNGWQLCYGIGGRLGPEYAPNLKSPLNYTRAEWQQTLRTRQNPKVIKATLQECWAVSDSRKAFEQALQERGYALARGDRRGFVAVDVYGEIYSLSRQLGIKARDLKQRLGDSKALPGVDEAKAAFTRQVSALFRGYMAELEASHKQALSPLLKIKHAMTAAHRKDRAAQKAWQEKRWQQEENARAARLRKGLKGVWDKLTGKYWKYREGNEKEA